MDNCALIFIKNEANNIKTREYVQQFLIGQNIQIVDEREVFAEDIDGLIDRHYFAIASNAVLFKPCDTKISMSIFESALFIFLEV